MKSSFVEDFIQRISTSGIYNIELQIHSSFRQIIEGREKIFLGPDPNRDSSLLEVKRLKKIGIGGLEKIENFYLFQPITLHPQNSIFFYLRTYPE